ncbi:hypothetical protein GF324_03700 [bacterium]|nr:hypothetical protein [bacterium]
MDRTKPAGHALCRLMILLCLLCAISSARAGEKTHGMRGLPYVETYFPAQTGGWGQCFDALQDNRGVLLLADLHGLLTYDGENWNRIDHTDKIPPLSLAKGSSGTIYVGYSDDFGLLRTNEQRGYRFHSLKHLADDDREALDGVWTTITHGDTAYFVENERLFRWKPGPNGLEDGTLHTWKHGENNWFVVANVIRDTVFVFRYGLGLMHVEGDSLVSSPLGKDLAGISPHSILEWGDNSILVATWGVEGELWYTRTETGFEPFSREIVSFSNTYGSSYAQQLNDSVYTLCSEKNGVAFFDDTGAVTHVMNKERGLSDNGPLSVYEDESGSLWVTSNYGLSRIDQGAPLSYFDERMGLRGNVIKLSRHNGRLYVATDQGLYLLKERGRSEDLPRFTQVGGVNVWTWCVASAHGELFISTYYGLFELADSPTLAKVRTKDYSGECIAFSIDSTRMYIGTVYNGIQYFEYRGNRWDYIGQLSDVGEHITAIHPGPHGNLWLNVETRYLRRLLLNYDTDGVPEIRENEVYDSTRGLPTPDTFFPFTMDGELYVGSMVGFYRYDVASDRFHRLPSVAADGDTVVHDVTSPVADGKGGVWFGASSMPLVRAEIRRDTVRLDVPVSHEPGLVLETVFIDEDGTIWGGSGGSRLMQYSPYRHDPPTPNYPTLVSEVSINEDSVLFEGLPSISQRSVSLRPDLQSISFRYALPYYRADAYPEYQYRVRGLQDDWSGWTRQTARSLVRPPAGRYTFEVRSRTRIGQPAEAASFQFEIRPAWYNTAWAYMVYLLLLGGLVWLIVRFNLRKAVQREQQLQRLLDRRAEEAIRQYDKARRSRIEAERLRTASQLAATIAHEFNNPLSIIAGACDLLSSKQVDEEHQKKWIDKVRHQVKRMSQLVDKLLGIEEIREIDYAAGKKIIDIHMQQRSAETDTGTNPAPPSESNGRKAPPEETD